jgi:hypothetical protein
MSGSMRDHRTTRCIAANTPMYTQYNESFIVIPALQNPCQSYLAGTCQHGDLCQSEHNPFAATELQLCENSRYSVLSSLLYINSHDKDPLVDEPGQL